MAAIKIHGSPISSATQRAVVALYEKGLDFEFVAVNLATGEHKQEPYLSKNPFGQVPAAEFGDVQLFESRAITRFVAEQYADKGTQLVYPDAKKKAATYVWLEVEANQFEPVASKLSWELVFKPIFGIPTDPAAVEENEKKLGQVLDVYEKKLSKSKYLAGDFITLADLHHLPNIQNLLGTNVKTVFESRPHVKAWVADIIARPAWAKVLALRG